VFLRKIKKAMPNIKKLIIKFAAKTTIIIKIKVPLDPRNIIIGIDVGKRILSIN